MDILSTGARKLLPWIAASVILGGLFAFVPPDETWDALRMARSEIAIPLVLGSVLAWFLIESGVYTYVFSRFNTPLSWREARSLRGSSYLWSPLHHGLGKAAILLRLRSLHRVPLLESTSTMALCQTIDGIALAGLAAAGLGLLSSTPGFGGARIASFAIVMGLVAYLAILRSTRPRSVVLERFRGLALHRTHRTARFRDHAIILLGRTACHLVFVLVVYLGTHAFGIDLPLPLALAAAPAIEAIGAVPITPAGLGTQQGAMLLLFRDFGTEASIIAFGLSLPMAILGARCLLGLFYLPATFESFTTSVFGLSGRVTGKTYRQ